MTNLIVTKELVDYLVSEVVPCVEQTTRWHLDIKKLQTRVIVRELAYETIVLRQNKLWLKSFENLNNHTSEAVHPLIEKMIESNILGAFEPGTRELIVVKENVDDSNLDGLKIVLSHELVHYGQYLYHQRIFDNLDKLKYQVSMAYNSRDEQRMSGLLEEIQPLMTLLESHAFFVEEQIKRQFYPEAKVESHFNWATIMMSVFSPQKQAQYLDGLPLVSKAAKTNGVDNLFRQVY